MSLHGFVLGMETIQKRLQRGFITAVQQWTFPLNQISTLLYFFSSKQGNKKRWISRVKATKVYNQSWCHNTNKFCLSAKSLGETQLQKENKSIKKFVQENKAQLHIVSVFFFPFLLGYQLGFLASQKIILVPSLLTGSFPSWVMESYTLMLSVSFLAWL